jgi:prepilin-type N-terminal cleavage/methylation domain-containing protein/prepilin-type processing-associated H-X9-DG protein
VRERGAPAGRQIRGAGFTLIELIVVMAIIGLLIALTLPAVAEARAAARRTQCASNLRNLTLAMMQFEQVRRKLPASGNYIRNGPTSTSHNHSWVVSILPYLEQRPVYDRWALNRPVTDPINQPLTEVHLPILVCPVDISRSPRNNPKGDLSYVVNGGVGFTVGPALGYEDCPVDLRSMPLDLNGDGSVCGTSAADQQDYDYFKRMGLFFLENWKPGVNRHHALADVFDGSSQTFMMTENVRAGYDPNDPEASYANPNPYRCAFYIGHPCRSGPCRPGLIDYSACNSGTSRINSGLWSAEGTSPVPNSFHPGGVNMAYADGHVSYLSESVDGAVYAALASPQGLLLDQSAIQQVIVSGEGF